MTRPAVHLLGGPTLFDSAGTPISGGPAQRHRVALLAQLVVAAPNAVSRDRLIGTLWPDRDTASARRLLNVAVTVLRQALGAELIVSAGDDLRLDRSAIDADVHQFDRALDEGRLEEAVASCRGVFLEGFFLDEANEFERWVEAQRLRLARRYTNALTVLAERATRANDHSTAIGWWRALGNSEPTNPVVVLQLMDALAATGDVTGALAAEEAHAAYMRGEVGIEPDVRVISRGDALRTTLLAVRRDISVPRVTPVSTPPETAPVIRRPRRRIATYAAIGLSVLIVAVGTLALRGSHRGQPGIHYEAVTAVLPLVVQPGTPADLSDGVLELLALNLDQVDGIRVVRLDPGRAAQLASRTISAGDAGRGLHAAFTVAGRLTVDSTSLTATFSLLDSVGAQVGVATARSPREGDELPRLVDDASVQLLRLLWGRRWFVPAPEVAAASTASVPALRAFLRGEAHFRTAHWDSAGLALQQAVDIDSTFALAYLRLAEATAWRTGMGTPLVMGMLDRAQRYGDRLPPREAALLDLVRQHELTQYSAFGASQALLERYPDDPDFVYYPADIAYHAMAIANAPIDSIYRLWDLAIAADPVSIRPLEHVIGMSLYEDSPERYDHYVALLRARATDSPDDNSYSARLVRWGPLAVARDSILSQARQFAARQISESKFNLLPQLLFARCLGGTIDCRGIDRTTLDAVLTILAGRADWRGPEWRYRRALSVGSGRMHDSIPQSIGDAAQNTGLPMLFGYGDAGEAERAVEVRLAAGKDQGWRTSFYTTQLALIRHDTVAARIALAEANRRLHGDSATRGRGADRYSPGLDRALGGWLVLETGDTSRALGEIVGGLHDGGYAGYAMAYGNVLHLVTDLAMARSRGAYWRNIGIDRLEVELRGNGAWWPWLRLEMARALDARGDRQRAADEYRRFALVWRNADPPLRHYAVDAQRRADYLDPRSSVAVH